MRAQSSFDSHMKRIRRFAWDLETLGNIPAVAKRIGLIPEIQTDEFWEGKRPAKL